MTEGCVFHIQRFSTDDGDGIRTCVFLKGCPLRCVWCHNAEGLSPLPEIAFYEDACIGCGVCVSACPRGALFLRHDGRIHIEREKCIACGACAEVCPTAALVKIGQRMTVDAVMDVVRRDRVFYAERGGVTVTGGEPMSQPAFTIALAKAAKEAGISVFVETSGYGREADFLSLLPYCDTFLFDCKAADEDHALLTGVNRAVILRNLDAICREGGRVRLRCPIVPDANLSDALIQTISSLAATYDAIESVQLMPYHKTGIGKSERLGKIPQPTFSVPDREQLETIARQIEKQSDKRVFF